MCKNWLLRSWKFQEKSEYLSTMSKQDNVGMTIGQEIASCYHFLYHGEIPNTIKGTKRRRFKQIVFYNIK